MAVDVAAVKEKVQAYLTSQGPVQLDNDGDFSIGFGSSRTFVRVNEHPNGQVVLVRVFAIVLKDVDPTPELWKHVALSADDFVFGHLAAHEGPDGKVFLTFSHRLLGDYLDKEELFYAVFAVAGTADNLDNELQSKFGGKRWDEV